MTQLSILIDDIKIMKLSSLLFFIIFFLYHVNCNFLSGDNPDLLYQELAPENNFEKTAQAGGNLSQ